MRATVALASATLLLAGTRMGKQSIADFATGLVAFHGDRVEAAPPR